VYSPVPEKIGGMLVILHRPATLSDDESRHVVVCRGNRRREYVVWTWHTKNNGANPGVHHSSDHGWRAPSFKLALVEFFARHCGVPNERVASSHWVFTHAMTHREIASTYHYAEEYGLDSPTPP
jgi:hypothetical protein